MTEQEFINSIAPLCVQYALKYKHNLVSPAIAQACLESGYGTSFKAQHHNYFGLKYRKNRVTCHNGYFKDDSKEQRADGSYEPIVDDWYSFEDMEHGVEGYYQFINIDYYKELKGMTSPLNYLYKLSELHYATALNYVENVNRVLVEHELYKYDEVLEGKRKEESSEAAPFTSSQEEPYHFTNSQLVTVSKPSRYNGGQRQHKIDTITIHCYVGQVTALQGVNYFNTINRQASCNYVVGKDGDIGLSTDEGKRSFCSSNRENDERAVTIETASDTIAPYTITDKALNSLILLCADICKRNHIKELKWSDNKDDRVNHRNGVNMTCHRDYAKKSCPGDYIYSKEGYIAEEVNKILKGTKPESSAAAPSTSSIYNNPEYKSFNFIKYSDDYADLKKAFGYNKKLLYKHYIEYGKKEGRKVSFDLLIQQGYLIQIKIADLNIREDATAKSKSKGYIKPGIYTIIEEKNGFGKLKSGIGWVSLKYTVRLT
jgi:hypothetical protein